MKNLRWTILAALVLAVPSVAQAQRPEDDAARAAAQQGGPGAPGATGAAGAPGATSDSGSISSTGGAMTDGSMSSTTNTTTTGMDTMSDTSMGGETTELANTGGEPFLMSLAGMSLLAGAFLLRRRVLS